MSFERYSRHLTRAGARRWIRTWWSLVLVSFAATTTLVANPPSLENPAIRSDGRGYHIWTRAILDRDLSFRRYRGVEGVLLVDPVRLAYQNKYPPGVALLRFPIMAWLVDRRPGAPLISSAEHWANQLFGVLALSVTCYFALDACRALSVRARHRNSAMLAVAFGTGLFHYSTFEACFSHVYSAACTATLVWLGARRIAGERERLAPIPAMLACFFLVLVRNTNVILLVALAGAYVHAVWRSGERARRCLVHDVVALASGAIAAVTLQIAYNHLATGSFTLSSYGSEGFAWTRPMQRSVLFSYERGLFTYYPLMGLALVAGAASRRSRRAAVWFGLVIFAYACLYGFWHSWTLGCGFGHRGFVETTPIAAVLLAFALSSLPPPSRIFVAVAGAICVLVTVRLLLSYWDAVIPMCGVKRAQYWSVVLGGAVSPDAAGS